MSEKILLSISEASKLCGLDDKVLSDEIKCGRIKVFKLMNMQQAKIPRTELEQWIQNNTYAMQTSIKN